MPGLPEEPTKQSRRVDNRTLWGCVWALLAYVAVLLFTRSPELADTGVYSSTIAGHFGRSPFDPTNTLWEFGHLLWRPLGWMLLTLNAPLLSRLTDWTVYMQAAFGLIEISWVASLATVVLWYLLLEEMCHSRPVAIVLSVTLACLHSFLLYAHSGTSYIPSVACLTAAVYLVRRDRLIWGAVFYSLSALLWLPFLFGGPGLFILAASPTDWNVPVREILSRLRLSRAVRFAILSTAIILIVYVCGGVARGVRTPQEAKDWVANANHGWAQSQRALRLVTGMPRSTFNLGRDGVLFKRYLRHDPYAPVRIADLVKSSLWKMAVFYLMLAALCFELWRSSKSWWPMLIFLAGTVPILYFAVFIFEPSSPERFLPALPFVALALGWVFRDSAGTRAVEMSPAKWILVAAIASFALSNVNAFAAPRLDAKDDEEWHRLAQLRSRITPKGAIVVATNQDAIGEFMSRSIFGPVNRPQTFLTYDAMEPATDRMLQWREEFAAYVFTTWKNGGDIWISRRLFSEKPKPEWNWVERDNPLQKWQDLIDYFRPLQTDADCDGADGFSRLANNSVNVEYLKPFAAAYRAPSAVNVISTSGEKR